MMHDVLQAYFQTEPQREKRGYTYTLIETEGSYHVCADVPEMPPESTISIQYTDEQEVSIAWRRHGQLIMNVQRIGIERVVLQQEDEEVLQFVLERLPSRMIAVQLKPFFAMEFGLFWEVCDECEES